MMGLRCSLLPWLLLGALLAHPDLRAGEVSREALEKACERGDTASCLDLGVMLYKGEKVGRDLRGARAFFQDACKGGLAQGCYNLAIMVREGTGGSKDEKGARELLRRACEGGVAQGCP